MATLHRPLVRRLLAAMMALAATHAYAADPGATDHGTVQPRPGFRDALTAPLEDLNLKKTDIPDVLVRAQAAPYAVGGLDHCEAIAVEIGRLDEVLGPDLEETPPPERHPQTGVTASQAHGAAVAVVQDRTQSALPLRSWLRKLTGAERNSQRMQAAARAGDVRRGYLKGIGMRMNCAPPAAPSWFTPVRAVKPLAAASEQPFWVGWWDALLAWLHGLGLG